MHTNNTGGSTVFATKRRNCIKDFIRHLDKKNSLNIKEELFAHLHIS